MAVAKKHCESWERWSQVTLKLVCPHEQDILKDLQGCENYVVKLIDIIGATDKLVIIVMHWLLPLGNHFSGPNSGPNTSLIMKLPLVAQFLASIQFIHNHRFAHLDLKPGNILLQLVFWSSWLVISSSHLAFLSHQHKWSHSHLCLWTSQFKVEIFSISSHFFSACLCCLLKQDWLASSQVMQWG